MSTDVLIVSAMHGAENCARAVQELLGLKVELANTRRAATVALKRATYAVVVVEEHLVEGDAPWADHVWAHAGRAIPVQVNFAISGTARLVREIRGALARQVEEQAIARRAVSAELEDELKSSLTGLLLQSELALLEPAGSNRLEAKLRHLVELAGVIRERLRATPRAVR